MVTLMQPESSPSLEALLAQAKESKRWFVKTIRWFCKKEGRKAGANLISFKAKPDGSPSDRAKEKAGIKGRENGDKANGHRYLKDMIRASVQFGTCADMRTALSIAVSDSYACAAPVDERCVALLRSGAVWSIEHHALVPAHEKLAASARALMMGVRRWDAEGKPYKVDIGPARGEDGVERRLPREIWELVFSFLIFDEGYRDARRAKRRRTS